MTLAPATIRVLVVGDVRFYTDGIAQALTGHGPLDIIGREAGGEDAVAMTRRTRPDVVLLDVTMGAGLTLAGILCAVSPSVRVVALGVAEVEAEVIPLIEAGVAGFVTRDASVEDIVATIESVADGGSLCSPRMVAMLLRRIAALSSQRRAPHPAASLTSREVEILGLIERGLSNKQIARELCIELPTVKNHVHHILEKLRVTRRGEAAAKIRATGRSGSSRAAPSAAFAPKLTAAGGVGN